MAHSFIGWINKPYLDLSPAVNLAPLHTNGVEFEFLNLVKNAKLPRIQAVLMPSFREDLISQSGMTQFAVRHPFDIQEKYRNESWQILCEHIQNFHKLDPVKKTNTVRLLNKLCFYDLVLKLLKSSSSVDWKNDSEIAYQFALAQKITSAEGNGKNTLEYFLEIVERSPGGSEASVNAAYQVVLYYIKESYDKSNAEYWMKLHLDEVIKSKNSVDDFAYNQFLSRYHRVNGFIPQMNNDRKGIVEEMDKAEYYAKKLFDIAGQQNSQSNVYVIAAQEMLYPVLESRTKEALWLEDLPLAECRARQFIEMCPNDSRARLNLGQVLLGQEKIHEALTHYKTACLLGPPGTEVSWFMLGQCFEALDKSEEAASAYVMSLQIDPYGISSRESLLNILENHQIIAPGFEFVRAWALELTAEYESTPDKANPNRAVKPYQKCQFEESAREN